MARNMQFHLWQLIRLTILLMAVQRSYGQQFTEKCDNSGSWVTCFTAFKKARSIIEASERCKNNSQELLKLDDLELHRLFLQDHFTSQLLGGAWLVSPSSSAGSWDSEPVDDYQAHCLLLKLHGQVPVPCSGRKHFVICYKEMYQSSTSKSNVLTTTSIFITEMLHSSTSKSNILTTTNFAYSTSFPSVGRHFSSTRVPIIIGGVIGGVVVVAIVVAILVCVFVCRKSKGFTNQLTGGNSNPRAVSNNYEDCDEQPDLGRLQRQTRNAPPAYNVVVENGCQNQNGGGSGLQPDGVVVGSHLYDNPRSPGASSTRNGTN